MYGAIPPGMMQSQFQAPTMQPQMSGTYQAPYYQAPFQPRLAQPQPSYVPPAPPKAEPVPDYSMEQDVMRLRSFSATAKVFKDRSASDSPFASRWSCVSDPFPSIWRLEEVMAKRSSPPPAPPPAAPPPVVPDFQPRPVVTPVVAPLAPTAPVRPFQFSPTAPEFRPQLIPTSRNVVGEREEPAVVEEESQRSRRQKQQGRKRKKDESQWIYRPGDD
jgi:hypothetical protein